MNTRRHLAALAILVSLVLAAQPYRLRRLRSEEDVAEAVFRYYMAGIAAGTIYAQHENGNPFVYELTISGELPAQAFLKRFANTGPILWERAKQRSGKTVLSLNIMEMEWLSADKMEVSGKLGAPGNNFLAT